MAGAIHGANAYHDLVKCQEYAERCGRGQVSGDMKIRTGQYLKGLSAQAQFKRDVALWYGAITDPGEAWKGDFLLRVFCTLYYGGLMVKRDGEWAAYANQRIPICSAVSHTARVLIQLPNDDDGAFWEWLWGDETPRKRKAASHGIERLRHEEVVLRNSVRKNVKEIKKDRNVDHFGVNVALGGNGNHNLISGARITDDGQHGHLYLGKTKASYQARTAVLIGAEQSAPIDRLGTAQGGVGSAIINFFRTGKLSVNDQYGGGHSLTAGHSRYSSTGGDDFAYQKTQKYGFLKRLSRKLDIEDAGLYAFGPSREHYYDGMFVGLTQQRFDDVKLRYQLFGANLIGYSGRVPR